MKEEIKALIEYRLQEAKESREEAEILLENGKNRGALNRVYYSMFYATLALLSTKQLSAVNGKVKVYQFRELKSVPPIPLAVVI